MKDLKLLFKNVLMDAAQKKGKYRIQMSTFSKMKYNYSMNPEIIYKSVK